MKQKESIFEIINRIMSEPERHILCVLSKEDELEDPEVPNNIDVGHEICGVLRDLPQVGQRFNMVHQKESGGISLFSTSPVVSIIYSTDMEIKFKTMNSIYLLVMPK